MTALFAEFDAHNLLFFGSPCASACHVLTEKVPPQKAGQVAWAVGQWPIRRLRSANERFERLINAGRAIMKRGGR